MLLLFVILLIPCTCICGEKDSTVLSNTSNKTNEITTPNKQQNLTKLTMVSEGGTMVSETPSLTLSQVNQTAYLILEAESSKSKESSSKPRKGVTFVGNSTVTETAVNKNITQNATDSKPVVGKPVSEAHPSAPNITANVTSTKISTPVPSTAGAHGKENMTTIVANKTKATLIPIKKPTITSYDKLANSNNVNLQVTIDGKPLKSTSASESTVLENQIQLSRSDHNVVSKSHEVNNPSGIVMPLVLTILIVPVFAVLGFMALKRGREAWKNRHYKRMDFLLDGMYND